MNSKLVVVCLVTLACGHPTQPSAEDSAEDFTEGFTQQGGCANVFLFAITKRDTLGVTFDASGLLEQVGDSPRTFTFQLPDPRVTVQRVEGTHLSNLFCADMGPGNIQRRQEALSGTATMTLRPGTERSPDWLRADLQLRDVVFEVEGERQTLPALDLTHILVGWLPA